MEKNKIPTKMEDLPAVLPGLPYTPKVYSKNAQRIQNFQFKAGNNIWMQRSDMTTNQIFTDPEAMAEAFVRYTEHLENNPLQAHKIMVVGQEIKEKGEQKMIPITWAGFAVYCGAHRKFFYNFRTRCGAAFLDIIEMIDDVMFCQKFSGAAAGFFNANLISRELGLVDKHQNKNLNINASVTVSKEEAKNISDALEDEY